METPLIVNFLAVPVLIACAGFFFKLAVDRDGDLHQKIVSWAMFCGAVVMLFVTMVKIANSG